MRLVLVTAAFALAGCGGGGSGSGSDGGLPISQFASTAVAANCHVQVLCGIYPDQATCVASWQSAPHYYDTITQDVASGKIVYDATNAESCLDQISAITSCNRETMLLLGDQQSCRSMFTGTVAVGGVCFFSEECSGGGPCRSAGVCASDQCCAGTCQAAPVAAPVGAHCTPSGTICPPGAVCGSDSICHFPAQAGASCTATACAGGLYCDSVSNTCKPTVATGAACDPSLGSQDCYSQMDICDLTTSTCTPRLGLGVACDPAHDTCASYAFCDAGTKTCVELPPIGAACDASRGMLCLSGTCDVSTGTCTLEPTAGACS